MILTAEYLNAQRRIYVTDTFVITNSTKPGLGLNLGLPSETPVINHMAQPAADYYIQSKSRLLLHSDCNQFRGGQMCTSG